LQQEKTQEKTNFINPNTIFDISEFCHSFPTILGNFTNESFQFSTFFRKNRTNDFKGKLTKLLQDTANPPSSLSNSNDLQKIKPIFNFNKEKFNAKNTLKFPSDIIFNGEIQDFTGWSNIIERIGEFGYNKHRFADELFSNTPIILTQHALNPEILFSQNEKVLEILFEEYKCPQLLICSQALINLLSFNQTSGTVVDLGESGTQISSIIDGYTQYNDSVYNSFLSGRNLNMLYYYEKFNNNNNNNIENGKDDFKDLKEFSVGYLDYFSAKTQREKQANIAFYEKYFVNFQDNELNKNLFEILYGDEANLNTNNSNNYDSNFNKKLEENKQENKLKEQIVNLSETEFRCYDGFYFYPKFFRDILSKDNNPSKFVEKGNDDSRMSNHNEQAVNISKNEYLLNAISMNNDSNTDMYQNLRALLHDSV